MQLLPRDRVVLWIAQGFWVGRIPVAPGTFGSLLGIGWLLLLAWPGSVWFYLCGIALSIPVSILTAGRAEKLLGKSDPGSVVIDEIIALPIAGLALVLKSPVELISGVELLKHHALGLGMVFLLFRLFDVVKPWPVNVSQKLPGGWGITVDDVLAAIYVNLLMFVWLK